VKLENDIMHRAIVNPALKNVAAGPGCCGFTGRFA
jgi:hypothetical protein